MLRLAVTGGLCSGKSVVSGYLRELGVPVSDADALGHGLLAEAAPELAGRLGTGILDPTTGAVDRRRLAQRVFSGPEAAAARAELNRILHPRIMAAAEAQLQAWEAEGAAMAGVEAALLIEAGLLGGFDRVLLVTAPIETRIERYVTRGGGGREDALARIAAQWPDQDKIASADVVIDNGGPLAATRSQVAAAWTQMRQDITNA